MRLKPVNFRLADGSIREAYPCVAFEFPPPAPPVSPAQKGQDTNPRAGRDGLDVGNLPDNLKVHPRILCQTSVKNPTNRQLFYDRRRGRLVGFAASVVAVYGLLQSEETPISPLVIVIAKRGLPIVNLRWRGEQPCRLKLSQFSADI